MFSDLLSGCRLSSPPPPGGRVLSAGHPGAAAHGEFVRILLEEPLDPAVACEPARVPPLRVRAEPCGARALSGLRRVRGHVRRRAGIRWGSGPPPRLTRGDHHGARPSLSSGLSPAQALHLRDAPVSNQPHGALRRRSTAPPLLP